MNYLSARGASFWILDVVELSNPIEGILSKFVILPNLRLVLLAIVCCDGVDMKFEIRFVEAVESS